MVERLSSITLKYQGRTAGDVYDRRSTDRTNHRRAPGCARSQHETPHGYVKSSIILFGGVLVVLALWKAVNGHIRVDHLVARDRGHHGGDRHGHASPQGRARRVEAVRL
jgi:hypothetical protein